MRLGGVLICKNRTLPPTLQSGGRSEHSVSSGGVSSWGQRRGIARNDSANVISTSINRLYD